MSRANRQLKILDVISKHDIDTQEELVALLKDEGFNVTQATISRDIKEMGIVKSLAADGRHYKYAMPQATQVTTTDKFLSMFKTAIVSIQCSGNLIVIKTVEASAGPVGELIDQLRIDEVLGVVAGVNTIFVAIDDASHSEHVRQRLMSLLESTRL